MRRTRELREETLSSLVGSPRGSDLLDPLMFRIIIHDQLADKTDQADHSIS